MTEHRSRSRSCAMRFSVNMATGKGLTAILRPRNLSLIGHAKAQSVQNSTLPQCGQHRRRFVTAPLAVDSWCRPKVQKCESQCRVITSFFHGRF